MAKQLTIAEVAQEAGVSISTVSRVLNHRPDVSKATAHRVREVIERHNFVPLAQAQRLASGTTRTIALVFQAADEHRLDFHDLQFIVGATEGASRGGFLLVIAMIGDGDRDRLNSIYDAGHADAVLITHVARDDWRVTELIEGNRAFGTIGRVSDRSGTHSFGYRLETGVSLAVEHVAELGHRQIAVMMIDRGARAHDSHTALIEAGFTEACERLGLDGTIAFVPPGLDKVDAAVAEILERPQPPTALLVVEPTWVPLVVRSLRSRGLSIPEDMSILSVMSAEEAELSDPMVTSIDLPAREIAAEAVAGLIRVLADDEIQPTTTLLPASFVVRESTGPCPTTTPRSRKFGWPRTTAKHQQTTSE